MSNVKCYISKINVIPACLESFLENVKKDSEQVGMTD